MFITLKHCLNSTKVVVHLNWRKFEYKIDNYFPKQKFLQVEIAPSPDSNSDTLASRAWRYHQANSDDNSLSFDCKKCGFCIDKNFLTIHLPNISYHENIL